MLCTDTGLSRARLRWLAGVGRGGCQGGVRPPVTVDRGPSVDLLSTVANHSHIPAVVAAAALQVARANAPAERVT